jgi:hypothetical protein
VRFAEVLEVVSLKGLFRLENTGGHVGMGVDRIA